MKVPTFYHALDIDTIIIIITKKKKKKLHTPTIINTHSILTYNFKSTFVTLSTLNLKPTFVTHQLQTIKPR